jgi:3D (Asp-Asp-Asp) domain-containing protein
MWATISQSIRRKIFVLVIAVVGFLFVYEAEVFDSRGALWQSIAQSGSPRPGSQVLFAATAYCKGSTTASGVVARTGVAAADPTLLPVGSVVNIAAGDARYSGVYTVMDTGPRVQGHVLDLYMWSCHEALKFGRKEVQVTVLRLGWDPTASSPSLIDRMFRSRAARRIPPAEPPPPAGIAPEGEQPSDVTPAEAPDPAPDTTVESTSPDPVAGQQ